ncbi:MAG: beta-galactosidase [Verrucomicrobia bacterium]|nr:beta-galactosidase [Verrucomicrobiota bacterium]
MRLPTVIPVLLPALFAVSAELRTQAAPPSLRVRVDASNGAPCLRVNGQRVRPRMFWGGPGSSPIRLKSGAQEVSFEFEATDSATTGTLHFRFGQQPGTVMLDDIRIVDLAGGPETMPARTFEDGPGAFDRDWRFWPADQANTVGKTAVVPGAGCGQSAGLAVTISAPPDGRWPDFHIYHQPNLRIVRGHRYRTTFWVKTDRPRDLTVACYRPGDPFVHLGGPDGVFESQIRLAAGAGVDFVSFPIPTPWPEPGREADWAAVDAACARVLRANPKALLLPRIGMDPPDWWVRAHPGEVMRWEDGPHRSCAVPASPVYREDAARCLGSLVRHLEEKFGGAVAGYHPVGQNTGEWFYEDTWQPKLNGYAPADLTAWRTWLAGRYGNAAALHDAWDRSETPETATIPTPEERRTVPAGKPLDPEKSRRLLDWAAFQQEAMADCVTTLAHAAREASGGNKLVVFFYGYVFEFAAVPTGPPVSGHYALRRVLDCPDIDVLCSPVSYFDRGLGESAPSMTAAESVALAGKLWLNEDDTHTYLATGSQPGCEQHVSSLAETNAELERNTAQAAIRNFGTWWMDLGLTGWFNDPAIWERMDRLRPLDQAMLDHPAPFHPEIAAVIDETAMSRAGAGCDSLTRPTIYEIRRSLGRIGAPYGQYLLDDVAAGKVKARMFVMLNPWNLTNDRRVALERATPGAKWLWQDARDGGPALTTQSLREAARQAGVHLYTATDCNVWANGPFISLHAASDGTVELDTGSPGPVTDILTSKAAGTGPKLTLTLKRGETRVLRLDDFPRGK